MLIGLLVMLPSALSVYLRCVYEQKKYGLATGNEYTCIASGLVIETCFVDLNVTDLFGNHLGNLSQNDVQLLYIYSQPIDYLPIGIGNFFSNLSTYVVDSTPLKYITKENFVDLIYLKSVFIQSNQIKVLNSDTFMYNKIITHLSMQSNKLKVIGTDLLSHLPKLQKAYFIGNACINANGVNVVELNALIASFRERCFDSTFDYYNEQQKVITDLRIRIEVLLKNNTQ